MFVVALMMIGELLLIMRVCECVCMCAREYTYICVCIMYIYNVLLHVLIKALENKLILL